MTIMLMCKWLTRKAIFLMLAMLLVLSPSLVLGGSAAQIKIEQAKLNFSEQNYKEALGLLDDALKEEPDNAEAYHYAGLCQMALDKPEAAVSLLEKAARLSPDDPGVHEDLAVSAIAAEEFEKAFTAADKALSLKPGTPRAMLSKGQAMIGLNNYQDALSQFEALSRLSGYEQTGFYYSGICMTHLGRTQDAANYFDRAHAAGPETDMGLEAKRFGEALRGGDVTAKPTKPWSARVRVLYQFDYNIVPVHSEDFLPEDISDKDDGRVVVDLDARYNLLDARDYRATVRYMGYGSWHARESEYNLVYHLGELSGYYKLDTGDYTTKLGTKFDYSYATLDNDHYSDYYKAVPEVSVRWSPMLQTRLVGDYMAEKFDDDFNKKNDMDKDNTQIHVALYQHFILMDGDLNTWLGYRWGEVSADGKNYDRMDNEAIGGGMAALPGKAIASVVVRYQDRDYHNNSFNRHEKRIIVNTSFQMPIYEMINIYTGVVYMTSDGNVKTLDYERWIYTIGLLASF